ncbi:hypothetical protein M5K25_011885 [Dendrobium thyrsiflorum]|uniref:Sugar phosphate transporter domain-containing protein n=1 Tax=Dendrobium thyrsiflorum TaxID=117978 RepID=A0ABD0VAX8_DENTH
MSQTPCSSSNARLEAAPICLRFLLFYNFQSSFSFFLQPFWIFSALAADSGFDLGFRALCALSCELPTLRNTSSFHFDFPIFGTNSFCAFALNLAVFLLVGKTSALTMNVAGVVKDWLLIAFSWSVIRDTVTAVNLFGYGIAFLGVAYYNHIKLQALKAKEAQKKAVPNDEESHNLIEERDSEMMSRKNDSQV